MSDVAAPAVHVKPWRHWKDHEALARFRRTVPEGCGVTYGDDRPQHIDLKTRQLFNIKPRTIDEQEWWDANKARIEAQRQFRRPASSAPRSAPPWTYNGHLCTFFTSVAPPKHFTYMHAFCGVSRTALSGEADLAVWPGLQPSGSTDVLQPICEHDYNAPMPQWYLWNGWFQSSTGIMHGSAPTPPFGRFAEAQGFWGVIEFKGAAQQWIIQWYHGNAGNKGPGFARPAAPNAYDPPHSPYQTQPLILPLAEFANFQRLQMTQALVDIEIPTGINEPGYFCGDICIEAVFGGVTLKQNTYDYLPLNWSFGRQGLDFGITCAMTGINNPANQNPNGYLQLDIGSS